MKRMAGSNSFETAQMTLKKTLKIEPIANNLSFTLTPPEAPKEIPKYSYNSQQNSESIQ